MDPIKSTLGLKQGCPLSPMLFNLYIDDIKEIFDDQCDPVTVHDLQLNHFLYADDLALLSLSQSGLQRCLDHVFDFSLKKRLSINIDKSKTLTFNKGGKYIKDSFTMGGRRLEPVQSFCYLGLDVKASGTVQHSLRIVNEKAAKAMRPLNNAISRFNLSVKISVKLFHSYIEPIILYNAENTLTLTEKQLELPPDKIILMFKTK